MSNAPTIANDAQLTVKELSAALGVSAHFVYQMRACGFPMAERLLDGYGLRPVLTATIAEAEAWIEANNFHLIHANGAGVINGQMKFCLQVDLWTVPQTMVKTLSQYA